MADQQFTVIPTPYHHHLFRSRLEARWAVYFDALGIQDFPWHEEPENTWRSPELISACLKAASWRF